jgi:hypothetical protein
MIVLEATQSFQCLKVKGFKVTQSLHRCIIFVLGRKNRKIADYLKGIKWQNRLIDSFLEEQRIGVTLTDSFFLNRAHHCGCSLIFCLICHLKFKSQLTNSFVAVTSQKREFSLNLTLIFFFFNVVSFPYPLSSKVNIIGNFFVSIGNPQWTGPSHFWCANTIGAPKNFVPTDKRAEQEKKFTKYN